MISLERVLVQIWLAIAAPCWSMTLLFGRSATWSHGIACEYRVTFTIISSFHFTLFKLLACPLTASAFYDFNTCRKQQVWWLSSYWSHDLRGGLGKESILNPYSHAGSPRADPGSVCRSRSSENASHSISFVPELIFYFYLSSVFLENRVCNETQMFLSIYDLFPFSPPTPS